MNWTLDVRENDGEWTTVAVKPSADACKSVACGLYDRADPRGPKFQRVVRDFRLYDPLSRLVLVATTRNGGWRMRWRNGDYREREQRSEAA